MKHDKVIPKPAPRTKPRVPALLNKLGQIGLAACAHSRWSLTDLGFAVARRVRAEERD